MTDEKINIEVDEVSLEDLIVLGNDKLIDIVIEFPRDDGVIVKTRAKIKQLTVKEVKNLNPHQRNAEASVSILQKSLYGQDGNPLSKEMILALPIGVAYAITEEVMRVSGVNEDMGKP